MTPKEPQCQGDCGNIFCTGAPKVPATPASTESGVRPKKIEWRHHELQTNCEGFVGNQLFFRIRHSHTNPKRYFLFGEKCDDGAYSDSENAIVELKQMAEQKLAEFVASITEAK